jgi:hypothetical protein
MRRWHQEREIMLRRWRQELAKHEGMPLARVSVPPDVAVDTCHCYRGMGFMRKLRPFDCGRPHCLLCHRDKLLDGTARQRDVARELAHEWLATGGW